MLAREIVLIADNAIKDLMDEWVLTLCVMLSLAAIIAPLLILFGLKQGAIETVREQLINDPVFRQITPKATLSFTPSFFEKIETDPRTEVVIRNYTLSASSVQLKTNGQRGSRPVEIHPTQAGDPLLLENDSDIPTEGEVVVTRALAEKYDLKIGESFTLLISRKYQNRRQTVEVDTTIRSILSARASRHEGIYARQALVSDIEKFRLGQTVFRDGWPPGQSMRPVPLIDGVRFTCSQVLEESLLQRILNRTDFSKVNYSEVGGHSYLLTTIGGGTSVDGIKSARGELRGRGCSDYRPWLMPIKIQIDNQNYRVVADEQPLDLEKSFSSLATVTASQLEVNAVLTAHFTSTVNALSFPVTVRAIDESLGEFELSAPTALLARLRSVSEKSVSYDAEKGNLRLDPTGHSGFRIYAKTIDDTPSLAQKISSLGGVEVAAKTDDIVRIQILNQGLTKIVLIVATVGLVGGSGALMASLIASVERKLSQMSHYRLIGFNQVSVACFPVVQGAVVSLLATVLAGLMYLVFGEIVDQFLNEVSKTANIDYMRLLRQQFVFFLFCVVAMSSLCSGIAVWRALRADPSEALRQE